MIIMLQNAATNISIPGWRRVARVYCGPERHNTMNVAACGFTTAANTYAVVANCSQKENENHADCCIRLVRECINNESYPRISCLGFVNMLYGKADKEDIVIFCTSLC